MMLIIHLIHYKVYLTALKIKFEIEMNILYKCTLLHIICANLHDLYILNSLSG